MDKNIITTDVIIPTYSPGEKFIRLINKLSEQTHPVNKLIIINTDKSLMKERISDKIEMLNNDKKSALYGCIELYHIDKSEFDHAFTRDKGVQYSKADTFVCMTDDAVPEDNKLLENLLKGLLKEEDIAMAYARQLPDEDTSCLERFTRDFNYPKHSFIKGISDLKSLGIKTYFASNVCCMYKRSIYDEVGGFEGPAIFNEDMVYAAGIVKRGYKIAYCADARVIHAHNYTAVQQLKRNFDLGVSQAMHKEIFDEVPSEGEGIRLVLMAAKYLIDIGKPWMIFKLVIQSAAKFIGYRLGKAYEKLPKWLVLKLAMNRKFVEMLR